MNRTPLRPRIRHPRWLLAIAVAAGLTLALSAVGCNTTITNRDPTGQLFPEVTGQSLEKQPRRLPADFAGKPTLLLVGYVQGTQFDIDRWLLGLMQARVDARLVEVPTIPGLLPTIGSGWIDEGMRSGIPREDWGSVVTLYGSAAQPVVKLTGNEQPRLTRVILLDANGKIVWFDDKGYSPRKVQQIAELLGRLGTDAVKR